ncbi:MAG: hypothetical protein LBC61_06305 [Candidatus Peribacteria bacterium]|jgi:hypothetical protein|nr:hypothetical protein [Candidatus Peribacteria bacterium]
MGSQLQQEEENSVTIKFTSREYKLLKPILTELKLLYAKEVDDDFADYEVAFKEPISPKILLEAINKNG